jgi:hypothetical protein
VTKPILLIVMATWSALLAASLRVHRHSRGHVTVRATLAGRGFYLSRTPDGVWWAIRVRRRRCAPECWWPDDPGAEGGVREPRRPLGPGPRAAGDSIAPLAR